MFTYSNNTSGKVITWNDLIKLPFHSHWLLLYYVCKSISKTGNFRNVSNIGVISLNFHVIYFFHMLLKESDWFYSLSCDINALSKLDKFAKYSSLQSLRQENGFRELRAIILKQENWFALQPIQKNVKGITLSQ